MNYVRNSFALLIIGAGLGWLAGISLSPIIQGIVTTLVAIVVTILSVMTGVESKDTSTEKSLLKKGANPVPVMFIVMGICLGAAFGIFTRTHGLLGKDRNPETQLNRLITLYTKYGIDSAYIAKAFLEAELAQDKGEFSNASLPVLFGISADECDILCAYEGDQLLIWARHSDNIKIQQLAQDGSRWKELRKLINNECKCWQR